MLTSPPSLSSEIAPEHLARFTAIVGDRYALTDPAAIAPYLSEERDLYHGRSPLVLRPGTVAEVAAILGLANATGTPIVPQGGNTGLVGGQTPHDSEIVLSIQLVSRLRRKSSRTDVAPSRSSAEVTMLIPTSSRGWLSIHLTTFLSGRSAIGSEMTLVSRSHFTSYTRSKIPHQKFLDVCRENSF